MAQVFVCSVNEAMAPLPCRGVVGCHSIHSTHCSVSTIRLVFEHELGFAGLCVGLWLAAASTDLTS